MSEIVVPKFFTNVVYFSRAKNSRVQTPALFYVRTPTGRFDPVIHSHAKLREAVYWRDWLCGNQELFPHLGLILESGGQELAEDEWQREEDEFLAFMYDNGYWKKEVF